MFQYIIPKFFERYKSRTFIDLEHFLKKELPNKEPFYYQDGGKFIMSMLDKSRSVRVAGNDISLNSDVDSNNTESIESLENIEEQKVDANVEELQKSDNQELIKSNDSIRIKDEYFISIKTPNIKFESKIENSLQLSIIETILQTIKVELSISNG